MALSFEIQRPYVLGAVLNAKNYNFIWIGTVVDAAVSVWKPTQARSNVVAGRACEINFGDPRDLGR